MSGGGGGGRCDVMMRDFMGVADQEQGGWLAQFPADAAFGTDLDLTLKLWWEKMEKKKKKAL